MDDLIRRQVLLAEKFVRLECALQANKDAHFDVYKRGWNDALQTVYDNAPSAQQWIPCSEMLPMDNGVYLVTDDSGNADQVEKSWFMWCDDGSPFWEYANVTAWMQLPKPYKGD